MSTLLDKAVSIELTYGCNLNCGYCYIPEKQRTKKYDKYTVHVNAIAHCKKIVEELKRDDVRLKAVMLLSSEPTVLEADILAICINILAERVNHVQIMTNGVNLANDEYYEMLMSKLGDGVKLTIGVTIDGYKELHDSTRDNSYDRANKTVDKLIADGMIERINIVVGLEAIADTERFISWYKGYILSRNLSNIPSCIEPPIILKLEDRMKIMKLLRELRDLDGKEVGDATETCDDIHMLLSSKITTCTNDCGTVGQKSGNLEKHNLKDLLVSRDMHKKIVNEECLTCDSSHICNVFCHWHQAPNGFAFNCAYNRAD